jgi:hypothetical protein
MRHFHQSPTFVFRQWPSFLDAYMISDFRFAAFVVNVALAENSNDLLKPGVSNATTNSNDDGLVHFVGNYFSDAQLAMPALIVLFRHVFINLLLCFLSAQDRQLGFYSGNAATKISQT